MGDGLRIVLAHSYYRSRGGEDVVFENERDLLRSYGHSVFSFTRHNRSLTHCSPIEAAASTLWNADASGKLRALIRDSGAQIVHFHNTFPLLSPATIRAAHAEGAAVVATLHNYRLICPAGTLFREGKLCTSCADNHRLWKAVANRCYRGTAAASLAAAGTTALHRSVRTWSRCVNRFIAVSAQVKRRHEEHQFFRGRIRVKANFVDPDPGVGPGDGGYALFAGRLTAEKGIQVLLDALREIVRHLPVLIAGDGPMAHSVEAAALRLQGVTWLGELPQSRVLELMGRATVVLVPSMWEEPFGRTVIEAFARGTPVVASDRGALPDLVTDGVNGMIVGAGDPVGLAGAVRCLASDCAGLAPMRAAARAAYVANFGPERAYWDLLDIYQEAMADRARPSGHSWLLGPSDHVEALT